MNRYRNKDKPPVGCVILMFIFAIILLVASIYREYLIWSFLLQ